MESLLVVEPTDNKRELLLDYLTSVYPPGKKRGRWNPFLDK